jgi:MFS transporter, CP family, cyanate transporter
VNLLPPTKARPSSLEAALLIMGVAALGFNLRGAISSLPPVFPELQSRLHLSSAELSLLAAAPVICFGVVSGFAAPLARKLGEELTLLLAIIALTIGLVLRAVAPSVLLFPGTILACAGIALMNVLLGSLIRRRWPERAGFLVGIYVTALSLGAIAGSLASVPVYNASGSSLLVTLGWLAIPAAVGAALWLPQLRATPTGGPGRPRPTGHSGGSRAPEAGRASLWRHSLTWQVTLFMGLQSLLYYATASWLPTIFRDRGASATTAGNLLGVLGIGNLALALITPVLAHRMRAQYVLVIPTVLGIAVGMAGAMWAPLGSQVAWMLILGAAQNAALGLAIYFTMARTPDPATAASLSAMAQAVGYLLASAGPLEVGLLHSATGSWTLPMVVLLALTIALLAAGLLAARPRTLPSVAGVAVPAIPDNPPVADREVPDNRGKHA